MSLRILISIIGSLLSIAGYMFYFWTIIRGDTRPLRITWGVWTLAGILGLWASYDSGAGIGLLVTATFVVLTAVTFLLSLLPHYGKPGGRPIDLWVGLVASIALVIWRMIHFSPVIAATIAVVADFSVLWLTLRESWRQPETE